jgi:hypothetical protein
MLAAVAGLTLGACSGPSSQDMCRSLTRSLAAHNGFTDEALNASDEESAEMREICPNSMDRAFGEEEQEPSAQTSQDSMSEAECAALYGRALDNDRSDYNRTGDILEYQKSCE